MKLRVLTPSEIRALPPAHTGGGRPRTRADCVDGPRPCPWFSCRHHLGLDLEDTLRAGQLEPTLKVYQPEVDQENLETCSLDVAARGEHFLEEVGEIMGLVKERVRQIEIGALRAMREGMTPDDD